MVRDSYRFLIWGGRKNYDWKTVVCERIVLARTLGAQRTLDVFRVTQRDFKSIIEIIKYSMSLIYSSYLFQFLIYLEVYYCKMEIRRFISGKRSNINPQDMDKCTSEELSQVTSERCLPSSSQIQKFSGMIQCHLVRKKHYMSSSELRKQYMANLSYKNEWEKNLSLGNLRSS